VATLLPGARLATHRSNVEGDVHEHVQHLDGGYRDINGHQARVAVVHHEVGAQRGRAKVVHAAGAVGHVAHYDALRAREARQDVRDDARKHEQALRKLQRHRLCASLPHLPNRLFDFEVVVGG
jgi:hypothetical protein